jgi:hypothetical protein
MNDRDKPSPDEILRPIRRASMSGSTAPETQIDADVALDRISCVRVCVVTGDLCPGSKAPGCGTINH